MNSEQQQQRIMGYFIEEAREHLQTIEQGVLNLQDVLGNTESVNELFRAAHSIKGGAAMLGVGSIQHVAHRLEDFFKILTENPQINVDERLKSLLLAGFDPLTELLDELQGEFRISDQLTNETSTRVKPVFAELESYLNQLVLDANGQVSTDQTSTDRTTQEISTQEPEEIPLELVISQESVFQEEVTTKMRDMLQLFRGNDSAESRSQLQAICNYFQEIGNDFDLRNWTNLVTQVKNAIAQSTNSYRTLAPILIRELKESQDLVLSNRETEISVSSKLESLLPYRFSEPEDDEISTIFTTASSDKKAEESIGESLGIVNVEQTETISEDIVEDTVDNIYLESDTDLDLFADQINEEAFDLIENPVEQMDWMDDQYAITEHQHIDGPKVGASELKSLAVLFENDDIDFDAAWEDIESNETHMSTRGINQASDSHDEFADLLDNTSDSDKTSKKSNLFSEESSIEQLFGDFATDEADAEDVSNSLFPEDLDNSWDQTIEISSEFGTGIENAQIENAQIENAQIENAQIENAQIENAQIENARSSLDELVFSDLDADNISEKISEKISEEISEEISDEEFDLNLGFDIFDQSKDDQIIDDRIIDDRIIDDRIIDDRIIDDRIIDDQIIDDQIVNFEDFNVSEASENITETDRLIVNDFIGNQIDTQDSFDSLSSEEYFAELERQELERQELEHQEQAIADEELSQPNEPFALTFSEEGMTLLDEPFAIDDNFEEDRLEPSLSNTNGENEEFFTSETDIFSSEAEYINPEETKSNDYVFPSDSEDFDTNNTSGLNIFDELGFDSDEIDLAVDSQNFDNSFDNNNVDSLDDFSIDSVQSSDDLADFFEGNEEIQSASIDDSDYRIFDEEPNISEQFSEQLGDFFTEPNNSANTPVDEVRSTDDLGDFFAVSEEPELIDSSVESEPNIFTPQVDSFNELNNSLANPEDENTISSDIGGFFDQEVNNTDDLGDFFATSEESAPITNISNSIDEINEINEIENELDIFSNNLDNLDNFFDSSEELKKSENLPEDITDRDWSDLNNDLHTSYQEANAIDTGEDSFDEDLFGEDSFGDFDSSQDINSDFFETENEDTSKEDLSSAVFSRSNHSDNSDLADLFADEDAMTLLENSFGDGRSLTTESNVQNPDIQNPDIQNSEYLDSINLQSRQLIDDHLTINQNVTDFDDDMGDYIDDAIDDITADNTIDNLADFFQVDDDSDISVLQTAESLDGSSLAVDESLDFNGFNEFSDLNEVSSETFDFVVSQTSEAQNFEIDTQLQTEGFNGIDDNFDFDDLEAMIGSSNPLASEIANLRDQVSQSFSRREPLENEEHYISDDMNFDELEALLGESDDFDTLATSDSTLTDVLEADTFIVVPEAKPLDDFDELENMLQSAFAKDVGPIKTKSSARLPTTTRKPRLTDSTMRVDVKYLDSLNNLVGELVVNRNLLEQDQERLQQFITNLLHQVQLLSDVSQRMRDQYDRSLLEASLSVGRTSSYGQKFDAYSGDNSSPISSATNDFEGIEFDRYNTFHVLSQEIIELIVRVRESASDIEFVVGETDQVTRQLGTITTQVQDDLKQSRMVPFAQIADRLPRGIRDRAIKSGKQAELEIYGRETLIDKAILEQLTDPLTHLVNNAIDHGLEDPATRQAAGKSATGRLTVRAYHQGNQTVISISDDGAGISTEKVKKSAVAKRVRTQSEVDQLNETEVYALLFEPGFSTAAQADEFKGRGVGLDVVKTCLDDIRGVIIVESLIGKGTTFTIRLPLTLSISKAMFCISDRARVAFPVDGFEDMVEVPQSQIVLNEKGQPCLPWRDTILPFQHLSNLLSYSRHLSRSNIYGKQDNDEICIIILRNDTSYLALQVDQFLGEYEIVIKQLEGPIPQPAGIAGATVLGDGRVMAIANVLELFDIASGRLRPSTSGLMIQPTVEEDVAADPTVLIVDDSITVRELLSLTFAKVGYRVEQAKDGQDAWEKLRAGLPCDMIFCDIEMPRMDGLDLLSRLQKDARLKDIPVAMLTSRGADRHRQSAIQLGAKGYFTKPYLEEELLSASKRMLNGETLPI